MSRKELIAALKKATGASFVLDQAIGEWRYDRLGVASPAVHKPYTASIDAALTLVPEGWEWCAYGACRARRPHADVWWPETMHAQLMTYAATPALALCIAALRASIAQEPTL